MISTLFARCGENIQLLDDSGELLRSAKGFVQPLNLADLDAHWSATPGGGVQREKFLLIAEPDAFLGAGAEKTVLWRSRRFTVLRAEKTETPEAVSHWEAILCPEGRRLL